MASFDFEVHVIDLCASQEISYKTDAPELTFSPAELEYGSMSDRAWYYLAELQGSIDEAKCPISFVWEVVQGPDIDFSNYIVNDVPQTFSMLHSMNLGLGDGDFYFFEFASEDYLLFGTQTIIFKITATGGGPLLEYEFSLGLISPCEKADIIVPP